MTDWKTTTLGKTGWKVSRLGLASSYGADERCVQIAFERGVNYLVLGLDAYCQETAALDPLDKGPLTPEEMDWIRRVGQDKYHVFSQRFNGTVPTQL